MFSYESNICFISPKVDSTELIRVPIPPISAVIAPVANVMTPSIISAVGAEITTAVTAEIIEVAVVANKPIISSCPVSKRKVYGICFIFNCI